MAPNSTTLPFGYETLFVLDDTISSASNKAGDVVRMHLKDPLIVGGRVIAPAGAPASLRVIDSSAAQMLDTYGFVDIYVEPLGLADGRSVPLGVEATRLTPRNTAGHRSTVEIEDAIEDIVIPYAGLYQIFRQGRNFVVHPGAELRARIEATLTATPLGMRIETPQPFAAPRDAPRASFQAEPLAHPMPPPPPPATAAPSPTATPT